MEQLQHETLFAGANLHKAITEVSPERRPLIEGLLYEKSALMLYADDGVGKSVLDLQLLMQATVGGSHAFESFEIARDNKILLFQLERHPDETFERMRYLREVFPFNIQNFALSVALQGTNLQDAKIRAEAIQTVYKAIDSLGWTPDIIAFDPIYTLVPDDLSTAPACNAITSFFRVIQLTTEASIIATTHTNRGVRDKDTYERKGKDMYGNRFLSAFFTGSYHIEALKDGQGSKWTRDKNSQSNLIKEFELIFDPSNFRSFVHADKSSIKGHEKLMMFLRNCEMQNKHFTLDDMIAFSGLASSGIRSKLSGNLSKNVQIVDKLKYGKCLYKYIGNA